MEAREQVANRVMTTALYRIAALAILPAAALAAPADPAASWRPPVEQVEVPPEELPPSLQKYQETSFRYRHLWIPRAVLDTWYFDADATEWPYVEGRPGVTADAYGLEYGIRNKGSNGIFYVEFIDASMKSGYWDDIEEPPDHLDGDWLEPTAGLGAVAFGADYAYEAHLVKVEQTQGAFGWSFLFGGGLGMAILTGDLYRWGPDAAGNPGYKRYIDGAPNDGVKELPAAFPMVDVNAATRLNFGNRAVFRIEGGLHTFVYFGATVGVML